MKLGNLPKRKLDRRETLLSLFNHKGLGLEVGPSYNPLLPKSAGYRVETVDYADAETLRKRYSSDPNVNVNKIEEVDYVSDGRGLFDLIGLKSRYDYIFASHVIEHVTDIIRFLKDCETLLKPEGVLVLAVPDKRFCFDALRPVSTVGQALQAYAEERKRHPPGLIFDHLSMTVKKAGRGTWNSTDLNDIATVHEQGSANRAFERACKSNEYHDVHAWQFTPSSFKYLIKVLRSLGYIKSGIYSYVVNEPEENNRFEFYVVLSKTAPLENASDVSLLKDSEEELREIHTPKKRTPRSNSASSGRKSMRVKNEPLAAT